MREILKCKNIYLKALELIENKIPFIIATVADAQGSTPQKKGSSALIGMDGLIAGTVGGGVTENTIMEMASDVLKTKESCYCRFDLGNDISEENASICGGLMGIILDAAPEKHINQFKVLRESLFRQFQGILLSRCDSDTTGKFEIKRSWITTENFPEIKDKLTSDISTELLQMLSNPVRDEFRELIIHTSAGYEDNYVFLESIIPSPQLIIAGAGHLGKALSHLGDLLDFNVTVWDDRPEYANKNNLPGIDNIICGGIDLIQENFKVNKDTYIVIVTRSHKLDSNVLKTFIRSDAGYIGMIGSKNKISQVREKFLTEGWSNEKEWAKVYTPVGLNIRSKTVQEIAVSIAAQLVLIRNS